MSEFLTVLGAVLPIFAIMIAGVFFRRWNWLTEEADTSLLKLTLNVLAPALIFASIVSNPALKKPSNILLPPLVGFITVAGGMWVGWSMGKIAGLTSRAAIATFAFCIGVYNYGYVPLPLAESLFDRDTVGVLFVHNLGVDIAFWTVGLAMLVPPQNHDVLVSNRWKKLLSPVVIMIPIAVGLNLLDGGQHLPSFIFATAKMLGACAIPMGLLLIGATMADHLHEFGSGPATRVMSLACVIRLIILPIAFLLLARFLPCSVELKRVIVLQSAMPSAVFPILITRHYGGDSATALRVVIATSAASLFTIPLWIRAGLKFVFGT